MEDYQGTACDLALALDGARFAERAGYVLDDWQARVLRQMPSRLLLNCSRQAGKTLVAALLSVHAAIYEPGAFVVAVAVAQRQSMELIRACRDIYGRLGRPVPAESENKLSLELDNGSRILSIPATEATVRGLSAVRLLIVDEAARVPDALYYTVLAFLAVSAGKLALLSTPWGTRGFYYQAYRERERWAYYEVPAERVPRIPASFLDEQRRTMGSYWFDQEFRCIFRDAQDAVFRQEDIDRMFSEDYPTWQLGGDNT
jgi:hypothetical protein